MGNPKTKTLFVQGIPVGEYVGSDDPREDVERARAFMRAKGITPPRPDVAGSMLGQANAFHWVANRAYEELEKPAPREPLALAPFIVNAALGVEIYLKAMHRASTAGKPRRGHDLVKLYDALPPPIRGQLDASAGRIAVENKFEPKDVPTLRACLEPMRTVFEDWRYAYESDRLGPVELRRVLLALQACYAVCRDVVRAGRP